MSLVAVKHSTVKAAVFLASKPEGRLLMFLAQLDANETCMRYILFHGSVNFDLQETVAAVKTAATASGAEMPRKRTYAMVEKAKMTAEKNMLKKIFFWLTDPNVWNILIPPHKRTPRLRSFGYRLMSSAHGHVAETLIQEACSFPTKSFSVSKFVCAFATCLIEPCLQGLTCTKDAALSAARHKQSCLHLLLD